MIAILILLGCLVALTLAAGAIDAGCRVQAQEQRDAQSLEAAYADHVERVCARYRGQSEDPR